jgi:ubiquitin-conjugating enzyme E2 variant
LAQTAADVAQSWWAGLGGWASVAAAAWVAGLLVICVLVADFLSGLFHWVEDSYFSADTPVVGRYIIAPNIEHHADPRAFLRNSWWESTWVSLLIGGVVSLLAWGLGQWHWTVGVTMLIAAHANTVHKWAHRSRSENGALIVALQRLRVIQSPAHHAAHHRPSRDRRYCVITPWVNPALDGVGLSRGLELLIQALTGVAPRPEHDAQPATASTGPSALRVLPVGGGGAGAPSPAPAPARACPGVCGGRCPACGAGPGGVRPPCPARAARRSGGA